jgi:hypothetical protein
MWSVGHRFCGVKIVEQARRNRPSEALKAEINQGGDRVISTVLLLWNGLSERLAGGFED